MHIRNIDNGVSPYKRDRSYSHHRWMSMIKCKSGVPIGTLCAWEIKSMDKFDILDPYSMKYYLKGLDIYEIDNSTFVTFTARLTLH
jgi:hypothetical protein